MPNLRVKLYPDDDHWVMLEKARPVAQDIRSFIDDEKRFPKESVFRGIILRGFDAYVASGL